MNSKKSPPDKIEGLFYVVCFNVDVCILFNIYNDVYLGSQPCFIDDDNLILKSSNSPVKSLLMINLIRWSSIFALTHPQEILVKPFHPA